MEHRHLRAERCNADLWQAVATDIAARPPGSLDIRWVKGHAKQIEVDRGHVLFEDKVGNDAADTIACAGADEHRVDAIVQDVAPSGRWLK